MNYTELTANIEDITEMTFTADQMKLFVQQAEKKIYIAAKLPSLRKNQSGTFTASNEYLSVPTDYLYPLSLAVINGSGVFTYLLKKDTSFIREAYPDPASEGVPKHYAIYDEDTFVVGPTPSSALSVEFHYGYYPESIVTATNTWLGDNFDPTLLNAALLEAARFMKQEPDIIQNYEKLYMESMLELTLLADNKIQSDEYRTGRLVAPNNVGE